ncbi:SAVED domain-containing protein [Archangium violaceum]|uniref:KGGVGR-motif variant AAA ATPase n=1 Tax=Archangium violaceum TaxID=83451 RepID=UPI001950ACF6|nr:SAVED domain-containing protein [Archangium violaceum]QRN95432.1 SAVED domain-containing protein [Archangium violaceum]
MGEIISFYSYKGGVGRSMAVANVATLLAQQGRRVLVVDFDLEAPGLHRYFLDPEPPRKGRPRQKPFSRQRGTIDAFVEIASRLSGGEKVQDAVTSVLESDRYGYSVRVRAPTAAAAAKLDFWSAGLFDSDYARRVHDFPWVRFYEERGEAFTRLAAEWKQRYDYVLLDSRTGISDLGSVSTVILPDKLVLAFTLNQQSLHGVTEFGRQAVELKRGVDPARPLALFPLLSRVEEGEERLRRSWTRDAVNRFEALFEAAYGKRLGDFSTYLDAVRIPHRGYYAYGESIAVEEEKAATLGSLAEGYSRFLDCLQGDALAGWQERIRNTVRPEWDDGALVVSFEQSFSPPVGFASGLVVKVPPRLPSDRSMRLRAATVNKLAWEKTLLELERGVEQALNTIQGTLHVFATLPYPAAAYLGRCLDSMARARPIQIHQLDPNLHRWVPFSGTGLEPRAVKEPCYKLSWMSGGGTDKQDVLLAIEGMTAIAEESLRALASSIKAHTYRLQPSRRRPLLPEEGPQAVAQLRAALLHLQKRHPAASIHIVTTAPVALVIELGRMLTPTVYSSAIVHQFEPKTARYLPVLDITQRSVVGARRAT